LGAEAKAVGQWIVNYAMTNPEFRNSETWSNFVRADLPFQQWTINFLNQNPNTTWTQFESWFITKTEGEDGEYIDNLDDILSNIQYQTKPMPTYSQFVSAFPKLDYPGYPGYYKQMPAKDVYAIVKGNLLNSYNSSGGALNNKNPYRNACTVRFSLAMNRLGFMIPNNALSRAGANVNGVPWYYYLQAVTAGDFMQKTFGDPTHKLEGAAANDSKTVTDFLKGKTGIYVIVNNNPKPTADGGAGYTGHVDLIQNSHVPGGSNHENVPGGIKSIRIWELNP
ncbi:MAG: T6SS effector amidase Tae4 family protein, partial [Bergeyella sp.]